MAPEVFVAGVLLAALVLYALSGGADFGGGVWDVLASGPRARAQREAIEHAIAPIWEANHVWLILVVTVLFTAFPSAFAAVMTALHIPLTAVLLGVVLRGSAFVFRKYDVPDDAVHRRWSGVFGAASMLTPFFLGLSLGAVTSGDIRVEAGQVTTGFFAGWTSPFAVGVGVFAQALFAFLAAVYLTVDTEEAPALQADFRRRGLAAGGVLIVVAAAVFSLARTGAPTVVRGLTGSWGRVLLVAAAACAAAALALLWARRFHWARALAILVVTLILLGWGLAQYPYLVVPDLTIQNARAAPATLRMLSWILAAGAVLLFPSFGYLYWVFKGQGRRHTSGPSGDEIRARERQ
jgi:cytochrome d ubiquinol oxidase subunit II